MRVASWLWMSSMIAAIAVSAGCRFDDHTSPRTTGKGGKGGGGGMGGMAAMPGVPGAMAPPGAVAPPGAGAAEKNTGTAGQPKKSMLGNVRARGERAKLDNELKQLALFFNQYCNDVPNPNARTLDGYLTWIKRDSPDLHNAINVQKYYTVNVKARPNADSIIAYETEPYTDGYYCVKTNNFLGILSEREWKAGLAKQ